MNGSSLTSPRLVASVATGRSPVRLSAKAIERYRACPKQFWFAHIERAPSDQEPSPQLAQGNAVHAALERLMGLQPVELRSPATAERALRSVWPAHRRPGSFASRDEEAAYGLEAVGMVRRFAERPEIVVEPLAREQWLTTRLENGAVLNGKLDRIDRLDAGSLGLVDYKTGRKQVDADDLAQETATIVYLLLAEAAYQLPVERVRYQYVRSGESVDWYPERDDVDELRGRLLALTSEMIERHEWPADPGAHCRWCQFALRCPDRKRVELDSLVPAEELPF